MVKRGLLQIFYIIILIYEKVKLELDIWINGVKDEMLSGIFAEGVD